MKRFILFCTLFISQISFGQGPDIHFTSPLNNQEVTTTFQSEMVNVNITYGFTLDPNPNYYFQAIKLITHNKTYDSREVDLPQWLDLNTGTYTWRIELWQYPLSGNPGYKTAEQTITFTVKYELMFSNVFQAGDIIVDQETIPSGTKVKKFAGSIAVGEYIDQYYGSNNWVWNSQTTNQSGWERKKKGQIVFSSLNQNNRLLNYQVEQNDNQAQIMAKATQCCNISRQDQLVEINQTVNAGVVATIVPGLPGQISAPPRTYNGRTYYFYSWSDGNTSNPRTITPSGAITYTALYKGVHLSQDANALIKNNQNKCTYVFNNHYFVYESQGKIWCEYSSNQGATWQFTNPPNAGTGSNPTVSEDYIAFQNAADIKIWHLNGNEIQPIGEITDDVPGSKGLSAFSVSNSGIFLFIYKDASCLKYVTATYDGYPSLKFTVQKYNSIQNTSANSNNPSLNCSPSSNTFHLAWEENNQINYYAITVGPTYVASFTNFKTPSLNTGFSESYKPSIIGVSGAGARMSWIGHRTIYHYEDGEDQGDAPIPIEEYKAIFKASDNDNYNWAFGNNVQSVNINKSDNAYVVAWGRTNSDPVQCTDNSTLSVIKSFPNLLGKDVQVSNGLANTTMRLFSYNTSQSPFAFNDGVIYESIPIEEEISQSREGIAELEAAQFYCSLEKIEVDGNIIPFKSIADDVEINTLSQLNSYLESDPVNINDNSVITYGIIYGITDSLLASTAFNAGEYISFKVELIDANTDEVYLTLNNVQYDMNNLYQYNTSSYQVNTNGLGDKNVKIRLTINTNTDADFSLVNGTMNSDNSSFSKIKRNKVINYIEPGVTSYNLLQNFPNPFNPSSTIRYQIPKDGLVTLKVYNILGKEVASLVNEYKNSGKYEVKFDASSLASGVYIYKLSCNDYTSIKKMTFLK